MFGSLLKYFVEKHIQWQRFPEQTNMKLKEYKLDVERKGGSQNYLASTSGPVAIILVSHSTAFNSLFPERPVTLSALSLKPQRDG